MPSSFTENYESAFIDKLQASGISYEEAFICILMYFRDISRPVNEMPAIFSRYSPKLTEETIRKTFEHLCRIGLIEIGQYGALEVYKTADDYEKKLEMNTKITGLADELSKSKNLSQLSRSNNSKVELSPKGVVSAEGNYATLLSRLKGANNTIKAAMLCTKVYEETAAVIEEMANKGVHIQLLIGSDAIVKKIRGSSVNGTYQDWKARFKNTPNVEVLMFESDSAIELCSSYLIDNSVLRLVVYDYASMRSLEGYLLEVIQKGKGNINIIHWYQSKFDEEWEEAKLLKTPRVIRFLTSHYTLSILATGILVFLILYFKLTDLPFELCLILIGVSLSYFVQISYKKIRKFFKKLIIAMKE